MTHALTIGRSQVRERSCCRTVRTVVDTLTGTDNSTHIRKTNTLENWTEVIQYGIKSVIVNHYLYNSSFLYRSSVFQRFPLFISISQLSFQEISKFISVSQLSFLEKFPCYEYSLQLFVRTGDNARSWNEGYVGIKNGNECFAFIIIFYINVAIEIPNFSFNGNFIYSLSAVPAALLGMGMGRGEG